MGEHSKIEWCHHTQNFWIGCARESRGCLICYAERGDARWGHQSWGAKGTRRRTGRDIWRNPLRWDRNAQATGLPALVFASSYSDFFEDHPLPNLWRPEALDVITATPHLIWLLLTKRPQNVLDMVPWSTVDWPGNVWVGTSVEDQDNAAERMPHLARIPAPVRFVSAEPLIGPLDLTEWMPPVDDDLRLSAAERAMLAPVDRYAEMGITGYERALSLAPRQYTVDWLITGGETGPKSKAAPAHPQWFRDLRDQATARRVPYFHKQHGDWVDPSQFDSSGYDTVAMNDSGQTVWIDGTRRHGNHATAADGAATCWYVKKKTAGALLDARLWREFPAAATTRFTPEEVPA